MYWLVLLIQSFTTSSDTNYDDITLVSVQDDVDKEMFDMDTVTGDELAKRFATEEQERFTIEEKAKLFKELLEQRRKHFAAKRAEEKRNKPPTKTQQKKTMINYLKNMEETAEEDDDQEAVKKLMEIVLDKEEVAIDSIPLAVKSPRIVDWKIHKEGKKSYYQIVRADGKSQIYLVFSHMLKSFDREDLKDLYKLVKARYGSTRPVEDLDLILLNDLKNMFEPHVEDIVWRNQQGYKVLEWKLYDSCEMLEKKLQIDYESEMAYQLCKLIINSLRINEVFGSILLVLMKL
ncbi:hypothetical protein Tco_0624557 [Tanacetum coccineum]|uniref:Uncharacterized protein n=1 Tax=Tanacetum coccineum TaxID=301880 RepID=A0ABQ4WE94_9ASTR